MYSDLSLEQPFYQGDILTDSPFFIIPKDFGKKNKNIHIEEFTVMILSQTCDIQHRDFIVIAPVITIEKLEKSRVVNSDQIRSLRQQKTKYWFYLPNDNNFPESYVEFTKIVSIPKKLLDKKKRIKSLSDLGRHWLAYKISDFFGRPIDRRAE